MAPADLPNCSSDDVYRFGHRSRTYEGRPIFVNAVLAIASPRRSPLGEILRSLVRSLRGQPTRSSAVRAMVLAPHWASQRGIRRAVSVSETELHALIVRSLDGDDAAYRQFLERLSALFRAFFRRKLSAQGASHAEDLVQETLLAVHLHRKSYDPSRQITSWVYAIARYKLIDHLRKTPAAREFVPVDAVADLFSEEAADSADPGQDIERLLTHLPSKQSTAIRLVKLERLTAKEAASRMGVSEADVKISIHRGLQKLMALVAREETP
jgi:RNA polymerase sigma-70 factor (ECF subfamily)